MVETISAQPVSQSSGAVVSQQKLEPGTEFKAKVEANLPGGVVRLETSQTKLDLRIQAPLPVGSEVTVTVSGSRQQPAVQITLAKPATQGAPIPQAQSQGGQNTSVPAGAPSSSVQAATITGSITSVPSPAQSLQVSEASLQATLPKSAVIVATSRPAAASAPQATAPTAPVLQSNISTPLGPQGNAQSGVVGKGDGKVSGPVASPPLTGPASKPQASLVDRPVSNSGGRPEVALSAPNARGGGALPPVPSSGTPGGSITATAGPPVSSSATSTAAPGVPAPASGIETSSLANTSLRPPTGATVVQTPAQPPSAGSPQTGTFQAGPPAPPGGNLSTPSPFPTSTSQGQPPVQVGSGVTGTSAASSNPAPQAQSSQAPASQSPVSQAPVNTSGQSTGAASGSIAKPVSPGVSGTIAPTTPAPAPLVTSNAVVSGTLLQSSLYAEHSGRSAHSVAYRPAGPGPGPASQAASTPGGGAGVSLEQTPAKQIARQVLPVIGEQQAGLGSLFGQISALMSAQASGQVSLPDPVTKAMQQILGLRLSTAQSPTGTDIQQAVRASGQFREAQLSAPRSGAPLVQSDLKSVLLSFKSILRQFGAEAQISRPANQPPAPSRQGSPQGQAQQAGSGFWTGNAPENLQALQKATDAALARVRMTQLVNSGLAGDERSSSAGRPLDLVLELPLSVGQETGVMQMQIGRDREGQGDNDDAEPAWRLRFALDLTATGPLEAAVSIRGGGTFVSLWVDRKGTFDGLNAMRETMEAAFADAGLDLQEFRLVRGLPQGATVKFGSLVDRQS